ncbi:MAG: NADH-quinone oxidoreductase subunit J [Dehalococcoidia bacterium]|nr:NADH-quinone oxidoreductase subunit J [Dehalococcoidia bacterium]MSQ16613.1 NADH-quinone oxidoreductase subunit J [Dehalococcoidia bacterium]
MLLVDITFWGLSVVAIGAALGVVLVRDLFRAALLLVVVFLAVAGFFVLLSAQFLAVVQVLIYAGAIAILLVFAVMLTKDVPHGNLPNRLQVPAAMVAALLLAVLVAVAAATQWQPVPLAQQEQVAVVQTGSAGLANLLVSDYALAFEAVSVLLLGAAIGALALLRGRPEQAP